MFSNFELLRTLKIRCKISNFRTRTKFGPTPSLKGERLWDVQSTVRDVLTSVSRGRASIPQILPPHVQFPKIFHKVFSSPKAQFAIPQKETASILFPKTQAVNSPKPKLVDSPNARKAKSTGGLPGNF